MPTDSNPVRCVCGGVATAFAAGNPRRHFVECFDLSRKFPDDGCGWSSAVKPTEIEAILAWNTVMEAARAAKEKAQ